MATKVINFGCRLNAYESDLIARRAKNAGIDKAVFVNSCAVTAEAVRQARQAIRRARREHPSHPIIVTGCAAQIDPQSFAEMKMVDLVLGNQEKTEFSAYRDIASGQAFAKKIRVGDLFAPDSAPAARARTDSRQAETPKPVHMRDAVTPAGAATSAPRRMRASVQIQTGCDHRCTFCVIPYGRGPSRSRNADDIINEIRQLLAGGHREIILTGVDLTSYGADLCGTASLGTLVRRILSDVREDFRLRLSSIDSIEVDAALFSVIAEEARLMPHFHLSVQAGDDLILKRMKRRHLRSDAIEFCAKVRRLRPDTVFGADLIAGFPTETDEMFANTLRLIDECGFSHLHVFPFSPRPKTPAARMPQLAAEVVRERARRLRDKGAQRLALGLHAQIGARRRILIEKPGLGRSEQFFLCDVAKGEAGEVVDADIIAAGGQRLTAAPISRAQTL